MGNFTCWHVQGMIFKANKEFKKAAQSLQQAVKIDLKNGNAYRDLGTV
jgi:Tfp pilus assembly protein PilF